MDTMKVGIVGCGNISGIYFKNCNELEILDVIACADLDEEKARSKAEEFKVPSVCTAEEILNSDDIDIVLNLTTPQSHSSINLRALDAGKHAYVEKPLSDNLEDAEQVMALAAKKDLYVGCAPDTVLGGGVQTCRKLINDGWIGEPVAATAFMMGRGHESWHPDPEFYYKKGGGPMLDMGPYYLTALVTLLGPISRVSGSARITFPERLITSEPKYGTRIKVETPTHIAGTMDFACGAIGSIIMSFDVMRHQLPCIEVYGTEGTLVVPDPNGFGGPVNICRDRHGEFVEMPLSHAFAEHHRGIGLAEMAYAIKSGRKHRASGELGLHVLEAMLSFEQASIAGERVELRHSCPQPEALPLGSGESVLS